MPIAIVNSLTRNKEEFVSLSPSQVLMYTCGVTVYDDCHVGHARSLYIFECIKRYLEYRGYKVKLVRNITDVDDKIINRCREEGVPFEEIRRRYIDNYYRDLKKMELEKADFEPLATENVCYMVDHIGQLIEKKNAYEVDGDVYFSVRSFPAYGALSGQSADEMLTAVRIDKDKKKKDPLDFSLWKKSKEGEPSWESPWGMGRPGWHIECSTMSMRYLRAQTFDIHAGGRDLIFPHHENEIAQAEALTGKKFARYWIHHGLLTIDGRKMSKSLGNFITIKDVLEKFSPNVIKLFFLSAHYASPIDFTILSLEKTQKALAKVQEFIDKAVALARDGDTAASVGQQKTAIDEKISRFHEVMDDDFNTAQGLAVLFDLVALGNKYYNANAKAAVGVVLKVLLDLGGVLGLKLKPSERMSVTLTETTKVSDVAKLTISEDEIEKLKSERRQARQRKDFKRADEIRDYLLSQGITIQDKEKTS
jgi:cysteinyl-tRNA synthetase